MENDQNNQKAFRKVNKGGAPSKLTQELIENFSNLMRMGAYVESAAAACGISKDIFYQWLRKGNKKKSGMHRALVDAVHKAAAEGEFRDLANIDKLAMGVKPVFERDASGQIILDKEGKPIQKVQGIRPDWKASAWRLERRNPKNWGSRQTLEHVGVDGGPIQTQTSQMTDEQLEVEVARLRRSNEAVDGK